MTTLTCPVCSLPLRGEKVLRCDKGHSFDVSADGYVNLLLNKKTEETGDDKEMSRARYEFLQRGFYAPLALAAAETCGILFNAKNDTSDEYVIADAGCGSGYYDGVIANELNKYTCKENAELKIFGFDLSKTSLKKAGKLSKPLPMLSFALANIFSIPLPEQSCDNIISIFAPIADKEFFRLLKPRGFLTVISPGEDHLFGLKSSLYDAPYKNECEIKEYEGFSLYSRRRIGFEFEVGKEDAKNLFKMTPYFYKTSEADAKKLDSAEKIVTEADFYITVYRKDQ
ncbi:MAG: methyltransferase domain-containing protein [Ruminococcaceae bacterium]|nr:methyltransferase domain-containing protein [Oscillospiraceae bacterium]